MSDKTAWVILGGVHPPRVFECGWLQNFLNLKICDSGNLVCARIQGAPVIKKEVEESIRFARIDCHQIIQNSLLYIVSFLTRYCF